MEISSNIKCWIAKAFSFVEADKHGHLYVSSWPLGSMRNGNLGQMFEVIQGYFDVFRVISKSFLFLFVGCLALTLRSVLGSETPAAGR